MSNLKTPEEISIMFEGGQKLAQIKEELRSTIAPGVKPTDLDHKAEKMIEAAGGKPSFKMVKDYHWSTCINVNDGVVHGIPNGPEFVDGDIVSIDVGLFYKGFHTDTSFTVPAKNTTPENQKFLNVGLQALKNAIAVAKPGNKVSNLALVMQDAVEKHGYSSVRALTGHGIGKSLHEDPQIPCFWDGDFPGGEELKEGIVLAIEVIYTLGLPDLVISREDNWTIATRDGKIAGLFEETVAVTNKGPLVLTELKKRGPIR